jgi:hypothetical protein
VTPYHHLRQAVRSRGGVVTPSEVISELEAYLKQFRVKPPNGIVWSEIYTRQEYWEYCNRRRKRKPKRKKGDADPILFVYDSIGDERVEAKLHSPTLDVEYSEDLAWVDDYARRQFDDQYNGEW